MGGRQGEWGRAPGGPAAKGRVGLLAMLWWGGNHGERGAGGQEGGRLRGNRCSS